MDRTEPASLLSAVSHEAAAAQAGGLAKGALVACAEYIGEGCYAAIRPSHEP